MPAAGVEGHDAMQRRLLYIERGSTREKSSSHPHRQDKRTSSTAFEILNVPVIKSSIDTYNRAILLHGIAKGMFRLFDIDINLMHPCSLHPSDCVLSSEALQFLAY